MSVRHETVSGSGNTPIQRSEKNSPLGKNYLWKHFGISGGCYPWYVCSMVALRIRTPLRCAANCKLVFDEV